ncbi:MAG: hypothetical protein ABH828_02615 [archaeon]
MVEHFFKKIDNHNEIRRKLLESSKEIIHSLKGYQKVVNLREKRKMQVRKLNVELKEINLFVDKMKDVFPAELIANFEEEKTKKEKEKAKKGKKKGKVVEKKKEKPIAEPSEVTKLENTLLDIENKLKRLS